MLFETLQFVGIVEPDRSEMWLRIKPMNLCVCDSEECEREVGVDVNVTMHTLSLL